LYEIILFSISNEITSLPMVNTNLIIFNLKNGINFLLKV